MDFVFVVAVVLGLLTHHTIIAGRLDAVGNNNNNNNNNSCADGDATGSGSGVNCNNNNNNNNVGAGAGATPAATVSSTRSAAATAPNGHHQGILNRRNAAAVAAAAANGNGRFGDARDTKLLSLVAARRTALVRDRSTTRRLTCERNCSRSAAECVRLCSATPALARRKLAGSFAISDRSSASSQAADDQTSEVNALFIPPKDELLETEESAHGLVIVHPENEPSRVVVLAPNGTAINALDTYSNDTLKMLPHKSSRPPSEARHKRPDVTRSKAKGMSTPVGPVSGEDVDWPSYSSFGQKLVPTRSSVESAAQRSNVFSMKRLPFVGSTAAAPKLVQPTVRAKDDPLEILEMSVSRVSTTEKNKFWQTRGNLASKNVVAFNRRLVMGVVQTSPTSRQVLHVVVTTEMPAAKLVPSSSDTKSERSLQAGEQQQQQKQQHHFVEESAKLGELLSTSDSMKEEMVLVVRSVDDTTDKPVEMIELKAVVAETSSVMYETTSSTTQAPTTTTATTTTTTTTTTAPISTSSTPAPVPPEPQLSLISSSSVAPPPRTTEEPEPEPERTFQPIPDINRLFQNLTTPTVLIEFRTEPTVTNQTANAETHSVMSSSSIRSTVKTAQQDDQEISSHSTTVLNTVSSTPTTRTARPPHQQPTTLRPSLTTRRSPVRYAPSPATTTREPHVPAVFQFKPLFDLSSPVLPRFPAPPNLSVIFAQPPLSTTTRRPILAIYNDVLMDTDNDVTIEMSRMNMATYVLAGLGMLPVVVIVLYIVKTIILKRQSKVACDFERYVPDKQPISPVVRLDTASDTASSTYDSIISERDFDRTNLRFKSLLGEGNFGQVWKAEADDLTGHMGTTRIVAVKAERSGNGQNGLKGEADIMKKLGSHPNVVTLLGACVDQEPHLLIMEFAMRGRLLSLLRAARGTLGNVHPTITGGRAAPIPLAPRRLAGFAHDIARGMEYISSKRIVHRDLAARNVLLDHNGVCKICDFGMSIDLDKSKHSQPQTRKADFLRHHSSAADSTSRFRFEPHIRAFGCDKRLDTSKQMSNAECTNKSRPALPIRWMAPEALQYHIFSAETDVWAYGIVMWEIVTLGCTPYPNLSGREVIRNIPTGTRPEVPIDCRPELFDLMTRSWRKDPRQRPTFYEVRSELARCLCQWEVEDNSVDYLDVSGFSEDLEHGMVYLNRRVPEFECEI